MSTGFDNQRNRSTILSSDLCPTPRKTFRAAMNFRGVEDHLGITVSGTGGYLVHIRGRPPSRAGKIEKESGKQFHFPFMLENLLRV